ncbi:hypothetical protein C1H87_08935 [Flavivirga eckloniae]|uniref:Uncharacterized protein n=1 Tax=Flavivirga eckloniae TaxID=1803846 RepID=A0A2K9PQG9_9FLAO|nr:hypothetical protein C1H87_08935 [Flavivirga eckloniae]
MKFKNEKGINKTNRIVKAFKIACFVLFLTFSYAASSQTVYVTKTGTKYHKKLKVSQIFQKGNYFRKSQKIWLYPLFGL